MILGIGVDIVEIQRFKEWYTYSPKRLLKIFSQEEIDYCLSLQAKSAERFAVRWAAREAFYKAWVSGTGKQVPFLTLCKKVKVIQSNEHVPTLSFDPAFFTINDSNLKVHISLSHSDTDAIAQVIIDLA